MNAISLAEVVNKTLDKQRSENQFELFWEKHQQNEKRNCASMTLLLREKRNHQRVWKISMAILLPRNITQRP